jgi:hypothetical protein
MKGHMMRYAYDTIDKALDALESAEDDVRSDMNDEAVDASYADIVEAIAWDCTPEVRVELMRRTGVDR